MKTLKSIMFDYLTDIGADGLCCDDCIEDGCNLDNFMPCEYPSENCTPAHINVGDDGELTITAMEIE